MFVMGKKDCPLGDDEFLCDLHNLLCPANCVCLAFALNCINFVADNLGMILPHKYIHISSGYNIKFDVLLKSFPDGTFITLQNMDLVDVCDEKMNDKIISLDMSQNKISQLSQHCFNYPDRKSVV